jgi:hypothetical protein
MIYLREFNRGSVFKVGEADVGPEVRGESLGRGGKGGGEATSW